MPRCERRLFTPPAVSRSALVLGTACGLLPPSASTSQGSERPRDSIISRSPLAHPSSTIAPSGEEGDEYARLASRLQLPPPLDLLRSVAHDLCAMLRAGVGSGGTTALPAQRPALRSFSFTPSGCEQAPSARCPCCTRSTLHMPGTRPRHVRDMSYAGARAALVRRGQRRPRLRGARVRRRAARRVRHLSFPRAAPLVLAAVQHVHPPPLLRLRHTRPKQPAPAYQQWPLNEKSC